MWVRIGLILCLCVCGARAPGADPDPHATGWRPLTAEESAYLAGKLFTVKRTRAVLPAQVKNTTHLPAVRSQGQLGTCSAFAVCYYYKTYQEARERGWVRPDPSVNPERVASPAWCFNITEQLPSRNGVMAIHYGMGAQNMVDFGCATWEDVPYSDQMDITEWPAEAAWRNALPWRGRQVGIIPGLNTELGLATLKEHLASGDLAVISLPVHDNFDDYPDYEPISEGINNNVLYANAGELRDGHALCVVGYDDNLSYFDASAGVQRTGAFLIVNSWGPTWGVNEPTVGTPGFCWLAYHYFLTDQTGDTEAVVMVDRIGHTPTWTAIIGVDHATGRAMNSDLIGGQYDLNQPRWQRLAHPMGNFRPFQQRIVVDLTDHLDAAVGTVWLHIADSRAMGFSPETGTVNYFALQRGVDTPIESRDTPKTTIKDWWIDLQVGLFNDPPLGLGGLKLRNADAAWGDYNNDGRPDLAVTGLSFSDGRGTAAAVTRIFRNDGGTTFTDIAAGLPQTSGFGAVAWGDCNNDGRLDLAVSVPDGNTRIFRNDGSDTFTDLGVSLPGVAARGLAWVDFDNDGRLDLSLSTGAGTLLYRNTGGAFVQIETVLTGAVAAALAWGDANQDGRPDLLAVSRDEFGAPFTLLYLNNGNDTFTAATATLPQLNQGSAAWGDINGDGILDLALAGRAGTTGATYVLRGLGNGTFAANSSVLTGLFAGAIAWGDVDNDGRPDLAVTGREQDVFNVPDGYFPNRTRIYRNFDGAALVDFGVTLPDVSSGCLGLADANGDSSLEVFLTGTNNAIYESNPAKLVTGVYPSSATHPSLFARINAAPAAPTDLDVAAGAEAGAVVLSWTAANDDRTTAAALRYSLRVGTTSGACDVVSGTLVPGQFGLLCQTAYTLRRLAAGDYYWSVRAVDPGFAASAWSAEGAFNVVAYPPQYRLTMQAAPATWGAVAPAPGQHLYDANTMVDLTATPAPGYKFQSWTGNVANPGGPATTIVMDSDRAVTANFAIKHDPSPTAWTQATAMAAWSNRYLAGAVVFNGQMWVLGGTGTPNCHDVWASENGATWTQKTAAAPWSGRYGHAVAAFNDKLWVLGGYDYTYRNDVWWSADGVTWTQATAEAAWPARWMAQALVFDNKLWLFGGQGGGDAVFGRNDVWWSSDGTTWTQATAAAAWPVRLGHAAVVFNNRMWVLGGRDYFNAKRDVWSSANGSDWTQNSSAAEWPVRADFAAVVAQNAMWVLGGWNPTAWSLNDVWYSYDGRVWTQATGAVPWTARSGHAALAFQDKLWVLGGDTSNGVANDVWYAAPGAPPDGTAVLTVGVSPPGAGTTLPALGSHRDATGTVFPLVATANPGYTFKNWSGTVTAPDAAATTTTLDADKTVIANFDVTVVQYVNLTVAVSPANAGTTTPGAGTTPRVSGATIALSATATPGYRFVNWTGPVADADAASTTVTPTENTTVTANFAVDPFMQDMPLAAGAEFSAVLKAEGTAWTWGADNHGQLGNATGGDVSAPWPLSVLASVSRIRCGARHTLALRGNGSVWAWGDNSEGQLGLGNWTARTAPVQVSALANVLAVACGTAHSIAMKSDGTVWTWGRNADYMLGCGKDPLYWENVASPIQVPGPFGAGYLDRVTAIAAGGDHTLALRDDRTVWAWGRNAWGQLGTGSTTPVFYATQIQGLTEVRVIAGGGLDAFGSHSLAVRNDGTVWAWGANGHGQLGDGTTTDRYAPVQVNGLNDIVAVAAGAKSSYALKSNGTLYAWGDNTHGQLGDGTNDDRLTPVTVTLSGRAAAAGIAAGAWHALAVDADGVFWAWGKNRSGQLGLGTTADRNTPGQITAMDRGTASFTLQIDVSPAGAGTTIPAAATHRAYANGVVALAAEPTGRYQFKNWTGDVDNPDSATTTILMDDSQSVTANFELQAGVPATLTMAVSPAGAGTTAPTAGEHEYDAGSAVNVSARAGYRYRFASWTGNVEDVNALATTVLMDADQALTANFTPVPFAISARVAAGGSISLVLKSDSTLWSNTATWPVQVQGLGGVGVLSGVVEAATGGNCSLALLNDGTVCAWGANTWGQLGDGTTDGRNAPGRVKDSAGTGTLAGIQRIATSGLHCLALADGGSVWAWGYNNNGQLGDNSTTHRSLPVPVKGEHGVGSLTGVTAIAAGGEFSAAVKSDGSVWTWGINDWGQLGNNSDQPSHTPVRVQGIDNATAIACGIYSAVALLSDGTLRAWGNGNYGQLGHGVTASSPVPVQVTGLTGVTAIAAGSQHVLALKQDGTVWAWGFSRGGGLGNNSRELSNVPVQVLGPNGVGYLTGVAAIAAGGDHSLALLDSGDVWGWGNASNGELLRPGLTFLLTPIDTWVDGGSVAVATCTLRVSVSPADTGTTVPIPGRHTANPGDVLNVDADPATGFRFVRWTGPVAEPGAAHSNITCNGTQSITAHFEALAPEPGDIDRDGDVDNTDVMLCLAMSVRKDVTISGVVLGYPYAGEYLAQADLVADGVINTADVQDLVRRVTGLEGNLPDPYGDDREPAPPETVPETKAADIASGVKTEVALSGDATRIELSAGAVTGSVELRRETNTIDMSAFGMVTSGAMRTLVITPTGSRTDPGEWGCVVPTLTIPYSETGELNADSVSILRLKETTVNGQTVREYQFLPLFRDPRGNLTVRDPFLPGDVIDALEEDGSSGRTPPTITIRYTPTTFRGSINWTRPALLVRTAPMRAAPFRKAWAKLTLAEQAVEKTKCVQNVIVLVHGHNEDEQAGLPGTYTPDADAPWFFSYKRQVWDRFYEYFLDHMADMNFCTVFYEFVYPSWRPIFGHLDQALLTAIATELAPQLGTSPSNSQLLPFNLFIVSHSMGGVVGRAAIQGLDTKLDDRFRQLVSWGSPHHGSQMYSWRIASTCPYYQLRNANTWWKKSTYHQFWGLVLGSLAMDTPGMRDLMWSNGPAGAPRYTTLDRLYNYNDEKIIEDFGSPAAFPTAKYDLRHGYELYNYRLATLNAAESKGDRITCLYGVTNKGLAESVFLPDPVNTDIFTKDNLATLAFDGSLGVGATANYILTANGHINTINGVNEGRSDGASTMASETGFGFTANAVSLGDTDHEEYYLDANKAVTTCRKTFDALLIGTKPEYGKPSLTLTTPIENQPFNLDESGNVNVDVTLAWPGDPNPGRRIASGPTAVQAVFYSRMNHIDIQNGIGIAGTWPVTNLNVAEGGHIQGTIAPPRTDAYYGLKLVLRFKDDTELHWPIAPLGARASFDTARNGCVISWTPDASIRMVNFMHLWHDGFTTWYTARFPAPTDPVETLTIHVSVALLDIPGQHTLSGTIFDGNYQAAVHVSSREQGRSRHTLSITLSGALTQAVYDGENVGAVFSYDVDFDIKNSVSISLWDEEHELQPAQMLPPYYNP